MRLSIIKLSIMLIMTSSNIEQNDIQNYDTPKNDTSADTQHNVIQHYATRQNDHQQTILNRMTMRILTLNIVALIKGYSA
jgi:hypothetical protein